MDITNIVGFCAALFVLLAFWMTNLVCLRLTSIVSNALFIWYAALIDSTPIILLHAALAPINALRLLQILGDQGRRNRASGGSAYLRFG